MSLQPAHRAFLDHLATTGDIVEAAKQAGLNRADLCRAFTDETFREAWRIAKQYVGNPVRQEIVAPGDAIAGERDQSDADPSSEADAPTRTAAADRASAGPSTRRIQRYSDRIDRDRARRQMLLSRRVQPDQVYKESVAKGERTTHASAGPATRVNLVGRASARHFRDQTVSGRTHDP